MEEQMCSVVWIWICFGTEFVNLQFINFKTILLIFVISDIQCKWFLWYSIESLIRITADSQGKCQVDLLLIASEIEFMYFDSKILFENAIHILIQI